MPENVGASGPRVLSPTVAALSTNFDGRITEATAEACSLTGFGRDEILFRPLEDFFPGLPTQELFPSLKVLPPGAELCVRLDLRRGGGTLRPVRLRFLPDAGEDRVHVRLGHERRAEDRLPEDSEFSRALLERCEGPVVVLDGQDRIVLASRACEELLGARQAEIRGKPPWDLFVSPEEAGRARHALERQRTEGVPTREVWSWRSAEGEVRRVAWRLSRLPSPGGRVFVLATGSDLTAPEREIRKQREAGEDARAAFHRIRMVLDAVPALISYVSLDRKYVFANRQYEQWFGMPVSRIEGSRVEDVVPPNVLPVIRPQLERALAGERASFQVEIPVPEGGARWIQATYSPDSGPDGRVVGVFVQVTDITDLRKRVDDLAARESNLVEAITGHERAEVEVRAEKDTLENRVRERTSELETALSDLRAFVYAMAHNLRAPLRAMAGFSQALREDYDERPIDALGVEYIERIEGAARRMDALVQGLLDFGRVAAGPLEICAVSLGGLVHQALGRLSAEISGRGARVEVSPGLPDVATDPGVLELALVHLLSNALKFVPPGARPEVKIRAEPCPAGVRLLVEDNGIGIDERHRDRLFGLFEQLHPPETYPGTGIGLAIVKKAMERMGGRVDFRSGPGQGSTFFIELRCAKSAGL